MAKISVSICDFGAKQTNELNTKSIQSAIDHCFNQGGGCYHRRSRNSAENSPKLKSQLRADRIFDCCVCDVVCAVDGFFTRLKMCVKTGRKAF